MSCTVEFGNLRALICSGGGGDHTRYKIIKIVND